MIEVDGQAVLIAGPSGAGKSSLTAGLLGIGARLVADDLSIVRVEAGRAGAGRAGAGRIRAYRGRPTMRQHRDTAARIDADLRQPIPDDLRGKWLVRPRARSSEIDLPLGGMLVLTHRPIARDAASKLALLSAQLFRPRWFAALPDQAARRRDLLAIAAAVPVDDFPAITMFDAQDQAARARHALARIRTMIARRTTP
jgi:energy-coupling factor transporter ATP-binding protein EcfA2